MSEHPIAAFADQVQSGMRISLPDFPNEAPVFVSQRRTDGEYTRLLGVHDDGRPWTGYFARSRPVLIHDLTPAEFIRGLS